MLTTLLIANRGEIACRVIRTARRMGLRTVAVYSEADADALHVHAADLAVPIGPAPARDSYLRIDHILEAARASGADAIHPGYGFLSENAVFAEACEAAGITFVGPPAAAIRAMGSKSAAKAAMARAGVPLVPGYHGEDQDPALLLREAERIGFPVLIKASAGGGGKGMRVVTEAAGFAEGLDLAKGEAASAFGNDQVLVERYLTKPRHIEIQVFADAHGNVVSLFERDCSVQRRHQKVVEEAPAPGMTPERRTAMGQAACDAARAIGYRGAGTVEFIVDAGSAGGAEGEDFFFMEMNTRLQVEHPVTEMVTGLDLVEWQLRVARGEKLPPAPAAPRGHAVEVRLYAEDPARDFMPSTGRLRRLKQPRHRPGVRVDTGVREGDTVTVHYDPMIAKLIVHGEDRDAALARLRKALAEYEVVGPTTNLELLRRIAADPEFARGGVDTGFIGRNEATLLAPAAAPPAAALLLAAAAFATVPDTKPTPEDPHSPWATLGPWRAGVPAARDVALHDGETGYTVRLEGSVLSLPGSTGTSLPDGGLLIDGVRHRARVRRDGEAVTVSLGGDQWTLTRPDPFAPPESAAAGGGRVLAPMPGRVVSVSAVPGAAVSRGDVLLVLEAMKVQMRLSAPRDGTVAAVHAEPGALVEEGTELVTFAEG